MTTQELKNKLNENNFFDKCPLYANYHTSSGGSMLELRGISYDANTGILTFIPVPNDTQLAVKDLKDFMNKHEVSQIRVLQLDAYNSKFETIRCDFPAFGFMACVTLEYYDADDEDVESAIFFSDHDGQDYEPFGVEMVGEDWYGFDENGNCADNGYSYNCNGKHA